AQVTRAGPAQAVREARRRTEADPALGTARVDAPPRLPLGLPRVRHDGAGEAGDLRHGLNEIVDADLHPRAEVDGLGAVVALGGQRDRLRRVLHVEKLARGCPVAPADDLRRGALDGLDALLDERWDHVRVLGLDVIARPVEVD